ncbi:MAG: fluoride efflux transporter CrcB [Planctomycetota bacterium]
MRLLIEIAAVGLGGAVGASLRYGAGRVLHASLREHTLALPAATLLVNVIGCFAIGAVLPWLLAREADGAAGHLRLLLVVGLLGGLTTYSAFGFEAIALWREGRGTIAIGYVALHLVLGLAAVGIGMLIGERAIA